MAESIKLNNDKYIDAIGVYDSTLGETQRQINGALNVASPIEIAVTMGHKGAYNYSESNSFYIPTNKTVSLQRAEYWDYNQSSLIDVTSDFTLGFNSHPYYYVSTQNPVYVNYVIHLQLLLQ